jgi:hypothetical protein
VLDPAQVGGVQVPGQGPRLEANALALGATDDAPSGLDDPLGEEGRRRVPVVSNGEALGC